MTSQGYTATEAVPVASNARHGEVVLSIRDLHVGFDVEGGRLPAVGGVDLSLRRGEILALVGESGSGKSALAMSLVGLNRGPNTTITGTVEFDGENLVEASERAMRRVRGKRISVVFQDALAALNPLQRAGSQVAEMLTAHARMRHDEAWRRAVGLFDDVGIASPSRNARAYPHQLSGGMRQRVMIAMGLANDPEILIADEPTTALDVTIQAQILELFSEAKREHDTAILLITHDLGVVSDVADRIAVMYAGKVVEHGTREQVLFDPQHPYTKGLLESVPGLDGPVTERLSSIPGNALTGVQRPEGCPFQARCPLATAECDAPVPLMQRAGGDGHLDACIRNEGRAA